ncbi:hypothetical protein QOZ60_30625, partial [Pseudomonas aeruginosa]|uniref:hypothetical protein n=1 Tax=Pseudomonas aeruginosa TaxID=287 RepID=UPI003459C32C
KERPMISPEGKALHDLFREFTQTLRYDTDDPDLFERLVSDPRYHQTYVSEAELTKADLDAEYEAGAAAGYAEGYIDGLDAVEDL